MKKNLGPIIEAGAGRQFDAARLAQLARIERGHFYASSLPFSADMFGAVFLLDLLEHTDDREVLAEVHRVLEPGGVAIVSVPALSWPWSYRDEAAGHWRRYSRHSPITRIRGARLDVEEIRYYQCLLFPLIVLFRLAGRRGAGMRDLEERPWRGVNAVLTQVNEMEVRLGDRIRWPWGSSIVAVCRKP